MKPQAVAYGFLIAIVLVAGGLFVWHRLRGRVSAEERERRRREVIRQTGKLRDGEVVDVDGIHIIYSYEVAGVGYTVSQDVSALEALLPPDRMTLVGPVAVKFLPRNPANSMVISEHWNGMRLPVSAAN